MTELTLNLAWTLISATSYAFLFRRFGNRGAWHASGASQVQRIIALTCVLAILFPVISLTDDLHEMQATAEEASPSGAVIKKCVACISSTSALVVHSVLFILEPSATKAHWVVLGVVWDRPIHRAAPGLLLSEPGRAPPSFVVSQFS